MSPSGSSESVPSYEQVSPVQVTVAAAVGGWFTGGAAAPSKENNVLEAQFRLSWPGPEICTDVPPTGERSDQSARNSWPEVFE